MKVKRSMREILRVTMSDRIISLVVALILALSYAPAQIQRAETQLEIRTKGINSEKIAYSPYHRIKVAEGEYAIARIGDLGIQPPGTEEFEFGETWTLWTTGDGEFEVQGEWRFESPEMLPNRIPFMLRLGRDLHPQSLKEFVRRNSCDWQNDSGPLSCTLSPTELYCESGAKDPKHMISSGRSPPSPWVASRKPQCGTLVLTWKLPRSLRKSQVRRTRCALFPISLVCDTWGRKPLWWVDRPYLRIRPHLTLLLIVS